jgi:hypothetical protein
VAVTHSRKRCAGSTPARRTDGSFVYRLKDAGFSSRKDGFDSHTGYLAKWWNGRHATLRTSCLTGVGVRLSPWSLRSGLELGFQHGLIRRPTPVQIRPPLMRGEGTGARGEQGCFSSLAPHSSPLVWAAGPTGRRRLCTPEMRVRLPRGPLTEGSRIWLAGPLCYSGSPTEIRVRLPCLPLAAPVVKRTIMPRFERGVPGSSPGRGIG